MLIVLAVSQGLTFILAATAAYYAYVAQSTFSELRETNSNISGNDNSQDTSSDGSLGRWIDMIEDADGEEESLLLLEAAHQRFPSNQEIVKRLADFYREAASPPGDTVVRREATLSLGEAVERFKSTCSPEDFDLALKLERESEKLANKLASDLEALRRSQTENALEELEEKVEILSEAETNSEKHLDRIAELDEEVDPEVLDGDGGLKERYDHVSAELTELMVSSPDEGPDREYNLRAVQSAQEAWEVFQENRDDWKEKTKDALRKWKETANPFEEETLELGSSKERRMEEVAYVLGGWDSHRLLPSVNKYITTVHSEIFEVLDREERQTMTQKMIEAPVKQ